MKRCFMTKNSFVAEVTFKGSDYCCIISLISKNEDIEKVLVSDKISFGEKTIRTLLVTRTIIIKLSRCI